MLMILSFMLPSSVIPWKMCTWMIKTKLKLNDDKTELIVISSKHQQRPAIESIQVGEETINHVPTVRNLGVLLDHTLSYDDISQLCQCHVLTYFKCTTFFISFFCINTIVVFLLAGVINDSKFFSTGL